MTLINNTLTNEGGGGGGGHDTPKIFRQFACCFYSLKNSFCLIFTVVVSLDTVFLLNTMIFLFVSFFQTKQTKTWLLNFATMFLHDSIAKT